MVTVAESESLPMLLEQVMAYAVSTLGETDCEPDVAFAPDHPPDAVQDVALVDDQERVEELPKIMDDGEADMETVGGISEGVQLS